jgi:hypothetical protein
MLLTKDEEDIFYGSASQDLIDFCIATDKSYDPQWFHEEIANALRKIETREIKRLIIEMPPRHGKSQLATINFPAFYLGRHPEDEIITASYSGDLASKFGGQTRDLIGSGIYYRIFPTVRLKEDTKAKNYWLTDKGGGYMSVGVGGPATGSGADLLIIDDPFKNAEEADSEVYREKIWEWYAFVARTRLEKDGAVIIIMTRWHNDDLVGRVLERQANGGEQWTRITFPAVCERNDRFRDEGEPLWPGKYDNDALLQIRQDIGERAWFSLYQQTPIAGETQIFRPEWMKKEFDMQELEQKACNRFITIDVADTDKEGSDWTGVTVVDWDRDNNWYVVFAKRYKVNILGLIDLIFNLWNAWKPQKIGVEKKAFIDQVKPLLDEQTDERQCYPVVCELEHRGRRKEARIIGALQGRFEKGKIWFKRNAKDDTEALRRELFDFPKGRWDDLCDGLAYIEQIGSRPFSDKKNESTTIQDEISDYFQSKRKLVASKKI